MLKRSLKVVLLVGILAAGAYCARASEVREVKGKPVEIRAMMEIARRSGELSRSRQELEALETRLRDDTAAVMSDIRAEHKLGADEVVVGCDEAKGILYVSKKNGGP